MRPPTEAKDDSPKMQPDEAESSAESAPVTPHVIIAEHVLLWDEEIVTWDEVVQRLRLIRRSGPFRAVFHMTHGAARSTDDVGDKENGWQMWHDRIMALYADLVEDPEIRNRFLERIVNEYILTGKLLDELFDGDFKERRPGLHGTLLLRAEGLRILHRKQTALLRRWRLLDDEDDAEAGELLTRLLITVNAIASGLRTTG